MPWNGSGTYNLPVAYSPEINGTTIDATRYNGLTGDVATGITAALAKNGENAPTANLPMGGFKHTGAAEATGTGQYITFNQVASIGSLTITTLTSTTLNGTTVNGTTVNGTTVNGTTVNATTATVSGTLTANGNVVLGDAAGDSLTINPNAVTWSNNPTHSGNHTYSGNLTVNGSTALGNDAADTLSVSGSVIKDGSGNWGLGVAASASDKLTVPGIGLNNGASTAQINNRGSGDLEIATRNAASNLKLYSGNGSLALTLNSDTKITAKGVARTVVKSATTSRNSTTTSTDDPDLVVSLPTGTWAISAWLQITNTTTNTQGFRYHVAFSGTTTTATFSSNGGVNSAAVFDVVKTFGSDSLFGNVSTTSPQDWLKVEGVAVVTVTGNLSIKWAQGSSSANNTNLLVGSYLMATLLA